MSVAKQPGPEQVAKNEDQVNDERVKDLNEQHLGIEEVHLNEGAEREVVLRSDNHNIVPSL